MIQRSVTCGSCVTLGVYNLTSGGETFDNATRRNIFEHLERFRDIWDTCDVFILEKQFFSTMGSKGRKSKGSEVNVQAITAAECVYTWFLVHYPKAEIMYFASTFKTHMLGCPETVATKPQRKAWSIERTKQMFSDRADDHMLKLYELRDSLFRKQITDARRASALEAIDGAPEHVVELLETFLDRRQKFDDVSDACLQCHA